MASYRKGRINDEVKKEVAVILRDVKDPRVKDAFLSVTGVEVTADLKYAKVYYSFLKGDKKEVAKGLQSCAGFVRSQIATKLNLRMTPIFTFIFDESIQNGAHISKLLHSIEKEENKDLKDEQ